MLQHKLYHGDCLDILPQLAQQGIKVDCILTDIPQQITQNYWDKAIPFDLMWQYTYALRKDKKTPIILFTNQPFTSALIMSNPKHFKVMKYWVKDRPSGFLNAKRQPLKDMEEIAVFEEEPTNMILSEIAIFYEKQAYYHPIMQEGSPNHSIGKAINEDVCKVNNNYGVFKRTENITTDKYPRQVLYYPKPHPPKHPTQKPIPLLEDLLLTYVPQQEAMTVLDFTCGINSTGIACLKNRINYIGIELTEKYYTLGKELTTQFVKDNAINDLNIEFFD